MKNIRIEKSDNKFNIDRELVSRIGKSLYLDPQVFSVHIGVRFKDGSNLSFKKDEEDDDFNARFSRDCED
jgi:hypothetical protein